MQSNLTSRNSLKCSKSNHVKEQVANPSVLLPKKWWKSEKIKRTPATDRENDGGQPSITTLVLICFGVSVRLMEVVLSLALILVCAPWRAGMNIE